MIIAIKTFQISYENPIFPDFSPRFSALLLSNISLTIDSILPKKRTKPFVKQVLCSLVKGKIIVACLSNNDQTNFECDASNPFDVVLLLGHDVLLDRPT
jgi:hypothetical protein